MIRQGSEKAKALSLFALGAVLVLGASSAAAQQTGAAEPKQGQIKIMRNGSPMNEADLQKLLASCGIDLEKMRSVATGTGGVTTLRCNLSGDPAKKPDEKKAK